MVPTSAFGLLVFLGAISPGLLYEIIRSKRFARPKESPFLEISRVLLSSVLLGLPAFFATWIIFSQWAHPSLAGLGRLVAGDPAFIGRHAFDLAWAALVFVVLSGLLAWPTVLVLDSRWWSKTFRGKITYTASPWTLVLGREQMEGLKKGEKPVVHASVVLKSGAEWVGKVAAFSSQHEDEKDLTLVKPIHYRTSAEADFSSPHADCVILHSTEISSIAVAYVLPETSSKEPDEKDQDAVSAS